MKVMTYADVETICTWSVDNVESRGGGENSGQVRILECKQSLSMMDIRTTFTYQTEIRWKDIFDHVFWLVHSKRFSVGQPRNDIAFRFVELTVS